MRLRAVRIDDAAAISEIYAPYVTQSVVSFETDAPTPDEIGRRIDSAGSLYPWLAAIDEGDAVIGYAYATAFRPRPAYRYAVETSVYVDAAAQRRGTGALLYGALLETLEGQGFVQAIAAITLPNEASVGLHERMAFEHAGTYRQVGYKLGRWHDVGLWQRMLAAATNPPTEPKPFGEVEKLFR